MVETLLQIFRDGVMMSSTYLDTHYRYALLQVLGAYVGNEQPLWIDVAALADYIAIPDQGQYFWLDQEDMPVLIAAFEWAKENGVQIDG
jgi:hypothetical protein